MRSFCTWRDTQVIEGYTQNLIFQFHFAVKIKQNIKSVSTLSGNVHLNGLV